jgi:uncharacterized protein (TIGR02118 family)
MIKMVDLLVRKDGYSHKEFAERWQNDHAELAKDLPGLRKYTTSVPGNATAVDYDGVLELYFDDMAALNEAFESEVGQAVQADAAEFIDMEAGPTLIVEETVQLDEIHD